MEERTGRLSVSSENIFPIIKKWLYTEQDIFVRELISNAADAITKRRNAEQDPCFEGKIRMEIDRGDCTLKIMDNGIGMDADEVDKYINQVAYSGASDFFEKYKNGNNDVIGHFGLGFYSAYMAADHVAIDSLSFQEGAEAVRWDGTSDMGYAMSASDRTEVGTCVTLYPGEKSKYLDPWLVEEIVKKYFVFFPIPIELADCTAEEEDVKGAAGGLGIPAAGFGAQGSPFGFPGSPFGTPAPRKPYGTRVVNDTNPLWCRKPDDCGRQEYLDFYKAAFHSDVVPKLWIHLYNEELGVKGIVYFRSEGQMNESIDGHMHLYCKQVFISNQAKSLIPDFLFLQDGIIDYENAPLMVSRSALQEDENVGAVSRYITEQAAFKLYGTFTCEREFYESIWEDLNPFLKFSCLKDKLLASYVEKFILFKNMAGQYVTLAEHLDAIADSRHPNTVYYISDDIQQAHYINTFRKAGIDALYMTHVVDAPYIKKQEIKNQELHFNRIDSDFYEALKEDTDEAAEQKLQADTQELAPLFAPIFGTDPMELKVGNLITDNVSSVILINEEERRVRDTLELYESRGIDISGFKSGNDVLFLNRKNTLVDHLFSCQSEEERTLLAHQLYDLARLGQESLQAQQLADFIDRSNEILSVMIRNQK